jgi:putative transposase
MARIAVPPQSDFPYHVSAKSINGDWFSLPMDFVWSTMCEQLYFIESAFEVRIHAFVLMSNHFHLAISTPYANLSEAMAWFMRETSRSLTRAGNRVNQTYGGRYFRTIIDSPLYWAHVYKYIYANPLRAGIVERAEDYKYSTLRGLLGLEPLWVPLAEDTTFFSDVNGTLDWINHPVSAENWEAVRKAMRKKQFRFGKVDRKPHPLETDTL